MRPNWKVKRGSVLVTNEHDKIHLENAQSVKRDEVVLHLESIDNTNIENQLHEDNLVVSNSMSSREQNVKDLYSIHVEQVVIV